MPRHPHLNVLWRQKERGVHYKRSNIMEIRFMGRGISYRVIQLQECMQPSLICNIYDPSMQVSGL